MLLFHVGDPCIFTTKINTEVDEEKGVRKRKLRTLEACKAKCLKTKSCLSFDYSNWDFPPRCVFFNDDVESAVKNANYTVYLQKKYAACKFICR